MRGADRWILGLCAGIVVFAVVYLLDPPGPKYYPLEHMWRMETIAGAPAMGWYKRAGQALLAGAVAWAAAGWFAGPGRMGEPKVAPSWLVYAMCAAAVLLLLAVSAGIVREQFLHWIWEEHYAR